MQARTHLLQDFAPDKPEFLGSWFPHPRECTTGEDNRFQPKTLLNARMRSRIHCKPTAHTLANSMPSTRSDMTTLHSASIEKKCSIGFKSSTFDVVSNFTAKSCPATLKQRAIRSCSGGATCRATFENPNRLTLATTSQSAGPPLDATHVQKRNGKQTLTHRHTDTQSHRHTDT